MTATLKVSIFLIIVGLIGKAILSDTQPITDDPCDYKECPICPIRLETRIIPTMTPAIVAGNFKYSM